MVKRNQSSLGMDLSDRTANFCRMTVDGGVVGEGKIKLSAGSVAELWREHGAVDVVVIEAGAQSAWVHELLTGLGSRVVVADPRKLKAVTDSVRKSDVRDARMLARIGLADEELLSPTYVRPRDHQLAMTLLKVRDQQVRARTATVLEVRSQVKLVGSRMPRCDADDLHRHEDAVPVELKAALAPAFRTLRALDEGIRDLDAQIGRVGETLDGVKQLSQVKGVGPITALAFVVVIGNPARFERTRDVGAYLGLVPRRDQSGESDPSRRISKAGSGFLRRLLTQCAHYIVGPLGRDCALRRWGDAQSKRRGREGRKVVVTAVARKLAVQLLSLWKSGDTWNPLHRVPVTPTADAPQPVVLGECVQRHGGSDRAGKTAPPSATRTQTCTGGKSPTTSANGSAGRTGASATGGPSRRGESRDDGSTTPGATAAAETPARRSRSAVAGVTSNARRESASAPVPPVDRAGRPAPPHRPALQVDGSDAGKGGHMLPDAP